MNDVELYWNDEHTHYAVLVSYGFGAGWSSWESPELAYNKYVVEFWLAHKDNENWMNTVNDFEWEYKGRISRPASAAYKEAEAFFKSIGYKHCPYMGGFSQIHLKWVPKGSKWRIKEYDGSESIEYQDKEDWNCF